MPLTMGASAGDNRTSAPNAPSTWNHNCSAAARSASASRSSVAPLFTVPAVPMTQMGRKPAARSDTIIARMAATSTRRSASTGTLRSDACPSPSSSTPFCAQLCASVEAYTISRGPPSAPCVRKS